MANTVAPSSPSKRPAAQVAFAKKAADAKAAKGKTNLIAPDLIDGNERELGEEALAAANRPAREHDDRSVRAAGAGAYLLSKRQVLAIVGVSYPTIWAWMRQGTFPRSRVVGGKSMWVSTEVQTWLAALPLRRLKGDAAPEALRDDKPSEVTPAPHIEMRKARR